MRPDFEKLMKEHNVHGMILNNDGMINALEKSYELGKLESEEKYNKLKNTFLDLLKKLNNTQTQKDWKKEGGLI
jgi:hypothetical protein